MRKRAKSFPAARKFALRIDASVASGQRSIEKEFKLPPGSVRLVLRSGRAARSDRMIKTLLEAWGVKERGAPPPPAPT